MSEKAQRKLVLTEGCWPVFEFIINFTRQAQLRTVGTTEQVRYEALSALRDAEDLVRNDAATERVWNSHVKPLLVYFLDYRMLNTDWPGRNEWFDHLFETDRTILDHASSEGGELFFRDCDELQKEYELAERRDRKDKDELAEVLSLYFVCLRLGFKGMYHDRPQELADYTRRLFTRLPAYASTRDREMFPQAYKHNQEVKVNYNLGMTLTMVLLISLLLIGGFIISSNFAWNRAVGELRVQKEKWQDGQVPEPPSTPQGG